MKNYENVILVGGTGILFQVKELVEKYHLGQKVVVLLCNNAGIKKGYEEDVYQVNKTQLMDRLSTEDSNCLVLSVMNPYLIPADIVNKQNLQIVNLHHAMLPKHRGRNAEAWAVYEGDDYAGITWHKINAGVDEGEIYIQKQVAIGESTTSLSLLTQLNEAALTGFEEIIQKDLLAQEGIPQKEPNDNDVLHFSKDVPNHGELDINWDGGHISRFLRAMDYGILGVLGKPYMYYNEKRYIWRSYSIETNCKEQDMCVQYREDGENSKPSKDLNMMIVKNGYKIILKKMKEKEK